MHYTYTYKQTNAQVPVLRCSCTPRRPARISLDSEASVLCYAALMLGAGTFTADPAVRRAQREDQGSRLADNTATPRPDVYVFSRLLEIFPALINLFLDVLPPLQMVVCF